MSDGLTLFRQLRESSYCRRYQYKKGDALINQGDCVGYLYLLDNADISVVYHSASGRRYTITREQGYSGILGEMEIFREGDPSVFSVIAESTNQCSVIEKSQLLNLITRDPALSIEFLKVMSARYESSITLAMNRILYTLRHNIIGVLLNLDCQHQGQWFPLSITQQSAQLGATSRSYRRILKAFIDEDLIEKQGRSYRLRLRSELLSEWQEEV